MLDLTNLPRFQRDSKLAKRILFLWPTWKETYPLVAIEKEIIYAHEWVIRNSPKYRDMGRFLANWFRRCQQREEENKALEAKFGKPPQQKKFVEQKPEEDEVLTGDDFKRMREEIVRNKLKGAA